MTEPSDEITHTEAKNARVPTELHCPVCKTLHVDQDEWAHEIPHRKHLCANCHHIWQPYVVGTVGVDFHAQCRAAREAADLAVAELRRQVSASVADQEKIQQLERDLAWTRGEWSAVGEEIAKLTAHNEQMAEAYATETAKLETRRDELLAMVAKLSQTVPLESEVSDALAQRGVLLAEIGTLKATIAEYEPLFAQAINDREFLDAVLDGVHVHLSGLIRPIPNTVAGVVGAVKAASEMNGKLRFMIGELQQALHAVCDVATTHLPEDREVVLAARQLAKKALPSL